MANNRVIVSELVHMCKLIHIVYFISIVERFWFFKFFVITFLQTYVSLTWKISFGHIQAKRGQDMCNHYLSLHD
jgi:hypothetical protein